MSDHSRWASILAVLVAGCDCSSTPSETECECGPAEDCIDGRCVPRVDGGGREDGGDRPDGGTPDGGGCESGVVCVGVCCVDGERCAYQTCVPDLGPCDTHSDCAGDSYCDADGRCTPYGVPPEMVVDETCERPVEIGEFTPAEQCRWTGPPAGDPLESWNQVYSAPLVADFDLDEDRSVLAPSIVFAGFGPDTAEGGVLRIVDGRTCAEQAGLTDAADRVIYATNVAIGDLDGAPDGRPEIVATSLQARESAGGLVAFGVDSATGELHRLWYGRRCDLAEEPRHIPNEWLNNNGAAIHDLDDDGVPEVLLDRFVYDADGCVLNPSQTYTNYLRLGLFPVVTDVDDDGAAELVTYDGVWEWDVDEHDWRLEPYWSPPAEEQTEAVRVGFVAIADLGDFPEPAVPGAVPHPEIVVAYAPAIDSPSSANGFVRVMTLTGDIVFGPEELPSEGGASAGRGGPPTIGDFDGDGRREFAVAGGSRYTVFDLDSEDGVLWSRPSQDVSSNVSGSSVFDFDADGIAEVVYGDECFLRIYRGTDGEVLFSQSASSGTGFELPVIADVDGDFNSEIVVSMTDGVACPKTDPIFTSGVSEFEPSHGIVVLRDAEDRWAASRPIWNQHAYHVTHVSDEGAIPATGAWAPNHEDEALNNFRMNAQGPLERLGAADLTVAFASASDLCDATGDVLLSASVCNRGTNPAPDGARVVFYRGDPDAGAEVACETVLPRLLVPGECTELSCTANFPPDAPSRDAVVVVDPDGEVFECRDTNNRGLVPASECVFYAERNAAARAGDVERPCSAG